MKACCIIGHGVEDTLYKGSAFYEYYDNRLPYLLRVLSFGQFSSFYTSVQDGVCIHAAKKLLDMKRHADQPFRIILTTMEAEPIRLKEWIDRQGASLGIDGLLPNGIIPDDTTHVLSIGTPLPACVVSAKSLLLSQEEVFTLGPIVRDRMIRWAKS